MVRARVLTAAAVVVAALGLVVGGLSGTASASHKQTPIVECVFHDTGTGKWISLWGYDSTSGAVETIPIGSGNSFSPGAQNQGQPTQFQPGRNDNVFTVIWDGSSALTWNLNGQSASATTSSTKCSQNPVPVAPGADRLGAAFPFLVVGVGLLGVLLVAWRLDLGLELVGLPLRRRRRSTRP